MKPGFLDLRGEALTCFPRLINKHRATRSTPQIRAMSKTATEYCRIGEVAEIVVRVRTRVCEFKERREMVFDILLQNEIF